MTPLWTLMGGIAAVMVLVLLIAFFLAAERGAAGDFLDVLPLTLTVMIVGFGVVFALTHILMAAPLRGQARLFRTMAVRYDGWVKQNMMGEFQLHLPHPLGGIEIDLRTEVGASASGDPPRWTRIALICQSFTVPSFKIDTDKIPSSLPAAVAGKVEALRAELPEAGRIHMRSGRNWQFAGPAVEVWLCRWPQDADELSFWLESLSPHLVALAESVRG